MNKTILSKSQIIELVSENKYKVQENNRLFSRCIDGRYKNSDDLAPMGFPGADIGDLAVIFSVANNFGFELDQEKAYSSFLNVIGGAKNFQLHSDHHNDQDIPGSGCGHFKQMQLDPKAYNIEQDQLDFIKKYLMDLKKKGAKEIVLEGDHIEGAVLMVNGNYSVKTRCVVETDHGMKETEVFIYHSTLVDERHRLLAKQLLADKAVELYNGFDAEYLYDALSETSENHLMETAKRLAKGLPIYSVVFKEDGGYDVEEIGSV